MISCADDGLGVEDKELWRCFLSFEQQQQSTLSLILLLFLQSHLQSLPETTHSSHSNPSLPQPNLQSWQSKMESTISNHLHILQSRATSSDTLDLTPDQRTKTIVACCMIPIIIILWNVPILKLLIYPFKLLTVAFHEFSHAFAGLLTCAKVESIVLEPDEGGATRMRGGIPFITLPAGYLGSSLIGAALIACGYNLNASKIATFVLAVVFILSLWWARRNWL